MPPEKEKDVESRFAYLLQPIRDLAKNWDVDVASQLEDYISEIEHITISFDSGQSQMNFAEAALLIQGSTCIYSKKVEYLYALVYQTLDLIASKRKLAQASSVDDQGRDTDTSFAQGRDQPNEFLALDDIKVGTNIDLVELCGKGDAKTVSNIPRTPMSLVPLQESERTFNTPLISCTGELLGNKADFKMNTGYINANGALLLEPIKEHFIEALLPPCAEPGGCSGPEDESVQCMEGGPPAVDCQGDESDDPAPDFEGCGGTPAGVDAPVCTQQDNTRASPPLVRSKQTRVRIEQSEKVKEPWQESEDPHEPIASEDRPLKKGKSCRVPSSVQLSTTRKRKKNVSIVPSQSLADFLLNSFYSCSSMFPKNSLKAPSDTDFESLYWSEQKSRVVHKQKDNTTLHRLNKDSALRLEQNAMEEERDEEDDIESYQPLGPSDEYDDNMLGGIADAMEGAFDALPQPQGADPLTKQITGVEPIALEEPRSAQCSMTPNYEDLVRNYVDSNLANAIAYAQETELSKRVQEWESRIRPRLSAEEAHPTFDMHYYGANLLKELAARQLSGSNMSHFSSLVVGKETYEICRMFAATLQLANDHNVNVIISCSEDEVLHDMTLQLLSTRMAHEVMSEYRAPSLQQVCVGGGGSAAHA